MVSFRKNTVKRKLEHRLDQVNDRLHVLEGLLTIFIDIDKVIKIIRKSDKPKKELIKAFKLSDIQANAILEIRLRQLAKLEQLKLEKERDEFVNEKMNIEKILKSKTRLKTLIKNELIDIKENLEMKENLRLFMNLMQRFFRRNDSYRAYNGCII